MSPGGRVLRRPLRVCAAAAVLLVLAGCSDDASSSPTAPPTTRASDAGTPLAELDTSALAVRRAPFCDLVDPAAVTRALGAEPTDVSAHRSGQRTHLDDGRGGGTTDVVHEFGCTWAGADGRAEAWVFAPPVTRRRAAALVALTRESAGCTPVADAPAYGDPSAAMTCRSDAGIVVSYRGLFGDAWLACALTVPGGEQEELTDRTGAWCAAVAEGASAG